MATDRVAMIWFFVRLLGCLLCITGRELTSEWTSWTDWDPCSRSCGGGISSQHRRCISTAAASTAATVARGLGDQSDGQCTGPGVRHRVCALQNCSHAEVDPSSEVCSALNSVLPNGTTLTWLLKTKEDDCFVTCSPLTSFQATGNEEIVYIAEPDGTRCRSRRSAASSFSSSTSAMGFCIAGKCQAAGCDNVLGSTLQVDRCGICGGNGSSCLQTKNHEVPRFQWQETGYTPCSVICGTGEQEMVFSCMNISSRATTADEFCQLYEKPPPRKRLCEGTDCEDNKAVWISDEWKECSRSCDGGLSLRSVYCVLELNDGTFERTSDALCRFERRPITEKKCNEFECPRWFAGQWSHCSASCGTGIQQRAVVCKRTDALDCIASEKPTIRRSCQSRLMCLHHAGSHAGALEGFDPDLEQDAIHGSDSFDHLGLLGLWPGLDSSHPSDLERGTEVAERLSSGHKSPVEGQTQLGRQETLQPQPQAAIHQSTGRIQTVEQYETTVVGKEEYELQRTVEPEQKVEPTESHETVVPQEPRKPQLQSVEPLQTVELTTESTSGRTVTLEPEERTEVPLTPHLVNSSTETDLGESWTADDNSEEGSLTNDSRTDYSDRIYDEYDARNSGIDGDEDDENRKWNTDGIYRGGPPVENKKATTVPSFVVSPWGECSTTCGTGTRKRKVICKVLLEPSKQILDLPDFKCEGPKPSVEDYCLMKDCSVAPGLKLSTWVLTGYGPCSKTCAGGLQEAEFDCLRVPGFYKVEKIRCLRQTMPQRPMRPCNTQACQPRWNPLAFGPCSASCGGGQQVRQLQCVQDISDQRTRIVPEVQCPDAAPPTVGSCNIMPCPAKWTIDNWAECSVTCGQGIQMRSVRCEQKLSAHQMVVVDDVSCWQQMNKPETERPCEAGKCHAINTQASTSSAILSENLTFVQVKPLTQVPLLVGTDASVIAGTSIVVHCPLAKNFSRLKVTWKRNDKVIDSKKRRRVRIDKHGSLRIRSARPTDKGVYSCVAGQDLANVTLRFHEIADSLRQLRKRHQLIVEEEEEMAYSEDEMKSFLVELNKLFGRSRKASFSGRFLLARMASVVPLQYVSFEWSPCSAECGGAGIQSRDIVCGITADEFLLDMDDGYCSDRRLEKPIVDRDCGFEMCPHWQPGTWTECSDAACSGVGSGQRRRPLYCISPNGQRVDNAKCNDEQKPPDVESCPHENCQPVWRPSSWTQCSVTCGDNGFKSRSFGCVWKSTKRTAGALCRIQQRPASRKQCVAPPCPQTGCRDESKYCQMVPVLQLCRYQQYRHECCHSCSNLRMNPTPAQSTAAIQSAR